jgi:hypothetical protein
MTNPLSQPFQTAPQGNVDHGGGPFAPAAGLSLAATPPGGEFSANRGREPTRPPPRANHPTSIEASEPDSPNQSERLRSEACRYNPHRLHPGSV